jgi:hypothetical protein
LNEAKREMNRKKSDFDNILMKYVFYDSPSMNAGRGQKPKDEMHPIIIPERKSESLMNTQRSIPRKSLLRYAQERSMRCPYISK